MSKLVFHGFFELSREGKNAKALVKSVKSLIMADFFFPLLVEINRKMEENGGKWNTIKPLIDAKPKSSVQKKKAHS